MELRSPGPIPEDPVQGDDRPLPGHPGHDPGPGTGSAPSYGGGAGASPAYGGDPGYGAAPGYGESPGYGAAPGYGGDPGSGVAPGYGGDPSFGAAPGYGAPPPYSPAPGYRADPALSPTIDDSPTAGYLAVAGYAEPNRPTEPPVFDLRFAVEADDAYDANVSVQQFIRWFIVVAVLIAVGFLLVAVFRGTLDLWTVGAGVLLVVGAILLGPVSRWFVRNQNRSLEGLEASATLNRWGMHFEGPLGRQDVPWASLTDVVETGRVIVFQFDTLPVAYLPRKSFASVQQESSAVAFARNCIQTQALNQQG